MKLEQPTREMEKTSTIFNHLVKVGLIRGVISEWSRQEQIEVLRATLMEVLNPKLASANEAKRNEW